MTEQEKMTEGLKTIVERINNNEIGTGTVSTIIDSVPKVLIMDHMMDEGLSAAVALGFHHHGFSVVPATNAGMEQLAKQNTEPIEFKLTNHHTNRIFMPHILPFKRSQPKVGRNALCPCGSGKKSKRCCNKD